MQPLCLEPLTQQLQAGKITGLYLQRQAALGGLIVQLLHLHPAGSLQRLNQRLQAAQQLLLLLRTGRRQVLIKLRTQAHDAPVLGEQLPV